MDREKARQLLDKLRMRTEARGATPAEAASAAALAAKIIERYGLNESNAAEVEHTHALDEKRFPRWAHVLGWAIEERFGCSGRYQWRVGQRAAIVFRGPEHLARVSCWLFAAIAKDLDQRSRRAGDTHGVSGTQLRKFRNEFRKAACWEVWRRMRPPREQLKGAPVESPKASPRRTRKKVSRISSDDWVAIEAGMLCGREISLDTDVIGERGVHAVAAIEGPRRPTRQATLF
jgi:hypothetical protein